MDAKAVEMGYQNLADAVSCAEEPAVPQFQESGRALRAWRSLVRVRFDEVADQMIGHGHAPPSDEELLLGPPWSRP